MRVGFTYDLRDDYLKAGYSLEETAEFDSVNTIESIEGALIGLGHQVERIGTHDKAQDQVELGAPRTHGVGLRHQAWQRQRVA